MKRHLFLIVSLLFGALTLMQAQAIREGDRFFDGSTLYSVREIRPGNILYLADARGEEELTLEQWGDKPGVYRLQPSRNADEPLLRVMRNAILAAHGYVFQSKDLKSYFEAQPWYHPAANNADIKLSLLEQLNVALIQAAERKEE